MLGSISPQINMSPSTRQYVDEQQVSPGNESAQVPSRNRTTVIDHGNIFSAKADSVQIRVETREIAKLTIRDREVRAHEAAHAAVGGQYAGSPSLTYKKGPNGRSYATSGEVSISLSAVSGDPAATLQKAEIIRSAALAPAQPSAQDMRVASKAAVMAAQARSDLAAEVSGETGELSDMDAGAPAEPTSEAIPHNNRAVGLNLVT